MYRRIIALLTLLHTGHALAYSLNITNTEVLVDQDSRHPGYAFDWDISGSADPSGEYYPCRVPTAYDLCGIGILPTFQGSYPRRVPGPPPPYSGMSAQMTLNDAVRAYINRHGRSGHVTMPPTNNDSQSLWPVIPMTPQLLERVCFTYVLIGTADHLYPTPLLQSNCAPAPPPAASCELQLPAVIDLGVVGVGDTATRSVSGRVACNRRTTVRARLQETPVLDRSTVRVAINNHTLGSSDTTVGEGDTFPLVVSATVVQPLMHPGIYQTVSVISITYD